MKKCSKCQLEKTESEFNHTEFKKSSSRCKVCVSAYNKRYRIKNKQKIDDYGKKWRTENKKWISDYNTNYIKENKEFRKEYLKEYNKKFKEKNGISRHGKYWKDNKDSIRTRRKANRENENKLRNARRKHRRKTDHLFRLTETVRRQVNKSFKKTGYTKNSKTQKILGCSTDEYKLFLENQFESWMNWENRGLYNGNENYGWDIDHIIPLHKAETEEELVALLHYSNTQPLCSYINRDVKRGLM